MATAAIIMKNYSTSRNKLEVGDYFSELLNPYWGSKYQEELEIRKQ